MSEHDAGPDEATLELVAAARAAGASAADAGQLVGRSARTVRRWESETDLLARIAVHRRERLSEVAGQLTRLSSLGMQALADRVSNDEHPEQLRSVLAVLDRALRFHAVADVEGRLADLEQRLADLEREDRP